MPTTAAERPPDREAEIADLEVALLQMLERNAGAMVGVSRQMHLAILADDLAVRADQDRGVVALRRAAFLGELGIAEIEADLQARGQMEQGRVAAFGISRSNQASISESSSYQ